MILVSLWLAIPSAAVTPGDASTRILPGTPLSIDSSTMASIGKVSVSVDGIPVLMEYNLETGDISRELDLKPGQEIRVETKVASIIGLTREFVSTFRTVEPVAVEGLQVNGSAVSPGDRIPPQPTLTFSLNKPVTRASVTLDGGDVLDLQIDESNPSVATLSPLVSLKQGEVHSFRIRAEGAGDGMETESQEIRAMVVKPLSLYGKAQAEGGGVRVELDASVPFRDPEAVKPVITTDLPDAVVTVEQQKIIITSSTAEPSNGYKVTVGGTEGADGSFLETPVVLSLTYNAGEAQVTQSDASSGGSYRGYSYSSGSSGASGSGGRGGGADSGPPPGWPSCCPWPPR